MRYCARIRSRVRELAGEQRRVVREQPVDGLAQRLRRHQFRQAAFPQERADRRSNTLRLEVAGASLQRVQHQQRIHADRHDRVARFGHVEQRLRMAARSSQGGAGLSPEPRQFQRHRLVMPEVGQRIVPPVGAAVAGEEVQDRFAHGGFVGGRSSQGARSGRRRLRMPRVVSVLSCSRCAGASGMEGRPARRCSIIAGILRESNSYNSRCIRRSDFSIRAR